MKNQIIISIIIVLLVIILDIITQEYTKSTMGEILENIEKVRKNIVEENKSGIEERYR